MDIELQLDEPESHDDKLFSRYQHHRQAAAVAADAAFVRAMTRAVRRGREKAVPGTYVDDTPPIGHKRLYGTFPISACGSPAAMCATSGGSQSGAETMK